MSERVAVSRRVALLACVAAPAGLRAAPDELLLGARQGYPRGTAQDWFFNERVRVGSFSHQAEIVGVLNGGLHELAASATPMPLPRARREPSLRWRGADGLSRSLDDYLDRQRVMGLMLVKDGEVQLERYQYERQPADRFVSHSMAKPIVSLGIGLALHEGRIASLDDRAERYAPGLRRTLYGQTRLRNLLRMASGARFTEHYDGRDDFGRFGRMALREGLEDAAVLVDQRIAPEGTRFNYASPEAPMLAAALRGATGQSLAEFLTPRLWQALGAERSALWHTDRTGLEAGAGHFNACLRDYARLGVLLANDGWRADTSTQVLPRDYLLEATDWHRHDTPFQPGRAHGYYGYGYHFWTFPGEVRRFAMLGVFGQLIFVDPQLHLVMVQTAADASPDTAASHLFEEALAVWQGAIAYYGHW